jgi:hypothetical protein
MSATAAFMVGTAFGAAGATIIILLFFLAARLEDAQSEQDNDTDNDTDNR